MRLSERESAAEKEITRIIEVARVNGGRRREGYTEDDLRWYLAEAYDVGFKAGQADVPEKVADGHP